MLPALAALLSLTAGAALAQAPAVPPAPAAPQPVDVHSRAPDGPPEITIKQIDAAIQRGREFLRASRVQGSWPLRPGSVNTSDRIPDYLENSPEIKAAVTAFCLHALRSTPGGITDKEEEDALKTTRSAVRPGEAPATNTIAYSLAYGLEAELDRDPPDLDEIYHFLRRIDAARHGSALKYTRDHGEASFQLALLVNALTRADRSWPMFMTLHAELTKRGVRLDRVPEAPPKVMLEDLAGRLAAMRSSSGNAPYSARVTPAPAAPAAAAARPPAEAPAPARSSVSSSDARNPLVSLALFEARSTGEQSTDQLYGHVIDFTQAFGGLGETRLAHGSPHSGDGNSSDYYYYFSTYYASKALSKLVARDPDGVKAQRPEFIRTGVHPTLKPGQDKMRNGYGNIAAFLAATLVREQDAHGGWYGSPYSGPNYDTAAAMLSLQELRWFFLEDVPR